jgi:hypothetical protein
VETGDRRTEDVDGATRNEENVVRLPRDWLGPREELVPIGPEARARAAGLGLDDLPPTADAFWTEDAAALHDAVQGPSVDDRPRQDPDPVPSSRLQTRLKLPRLSIGQALRPHRTRLSRRAVAALVALPVVAVLVVGVIGGGAGTTTSPPGQGSTSSLNVASAGAGTTAGAQFHRPAADGRSLAKSAAVDAARGRGTSHARSRAREAHVRAKVQRRTPHVSHRGATRPHAIEPASQPNTTVAAAPTPTSPAAPPVTTTPVTTPASTPAGGSSNGTAASARQTAFGLNGTLGPGRSPDS